MNSLCKVINGEKGYSLVEMLVVLSVFLLLISASISTMPKYQGKKELESFLQQFSKDFHFAQMYAINHQISVYFSIDYINKTYYANSIGSDEVIFFKRIPKDIQFMKDSLILRIYFTPIGNVSNFGSWVFESKKVQYIFTVMIGRGRHYYREL
ncbi:competence type IV pilus minor pilin ComGD [Bacillus massiliigorillae]|uniref:competence type IV pilus minor pilin ComGD n=1 Tax=Bacillus massiliigorillae TaxID=1243664 RepID=UPI00039A5A4A|nr:competence type IV pilus minor pilin ComGD [Bacillus massiliigorillae]